MATARPRHRDEFEIAIICALEDEFNAVEALFDEHWEQDGDSYGKAAGDPNAYSIGRIGQHNVVLAFMPGIGKAASASVAASFCTSFTGIKLGLVVGICGGIPSDAGKDIFLGDVVISTGVIEFDFGRQLPDQFVRKDTLQDSLGRPNAEIRSFLQKLMSRNGRMQLASGLSQYFDDLLSMNGFANSRFPGVEKDKLYEPHYRHKHQDPEVCRICARCKSMDDPVCISALQASCTEAGCDDKHLIKRKRTQNSANASASTENVSLQEGNRQPEIHFGRIASGGAVMKSGSRRDELAAAEKVIAFEMEGAGVWDNFPTVVIKSICDYSDSHKNKDWQKYAAACAAACMKAFLSIWRASDKPGRQDINAANRGQTNYDLGLHISEAPEIDTTIFVGREEELKTMATVLLPDADGDTQKCLILSGLGGMGKTQLSIQFAKLYQQHFSTVVWLKAQSESTLRQSLVNFGKYLFMDPESRAEGEDDRNEDQLIDRVRSWLSQSNNMKWLLIFDNYDDPLLSGIGSHNSYDIKRFFPNISQGSILVTTRVTRLDFGASLMLKKLDQETQGIEILARRAHRDGARTDPDAARLASRLDGLPLALATAGNFLRHVPVSFGEYLKYYENSWNDLEDTAVGLPDYQGRTLYTTWNLSLGQLPVEAQDLMRLMAYFDNQEIWFELLHAAAENAPPSLCKTLSSKIIFSATMRNLQDYSLVEAHHDTEAYSLHKCVHDWTLDHLNRQPNPSMYTIALSAVAESVVSTRRKNHWQIDLRLEPHALWLSLKRMRDLLPNNEAMSKKSATIAEVLRRRGRVMEAIEAFEWTLARNDINDPMLPWQFDAVTRLGMLYIDIGMPEKAEKMFRQALAASQELKGPDSFQSLAALNNLAEVLLNQGMIQEAERLFQEAILGEEMVLGSDHNLTLKTLRNLARIHRRQGKIKEAEEVFNRLLTQYEERYGPDHHETLGVTNDLARIYSIEGRFSEAERMFAKTLSGKEKVLGPFHRSTLKTVSAFAALYSKLGKLDNAEELYQRSVSGFEKVLGSEHPYVADSTRRLANVQKRKRKKSTLKDELPMIN